MSRPCRTLGFLALGIAALAPAQVVMGREGVRIDGIGARTAQGAVTVAANRRRATYAGRGRDFVVNGNDCRIVITGRTRSVTVNGNRNNVRLVEVATLNVAGNGNAVRWLRGPKGGRPRVSDLGNGNRVARS